MQEKDKTNDLILDEVFGDISLTEKEKDFVLYYLESYNATQSHMKAYGSNKKTAYVAGHTVLKREHVQQAIRRARKILAVSNDLDPSRYVNSLLEIANADIGDFLEFKQEEVQVYDKEGLPVLNPDTGEPKTKKVSRVYLKDSDKVDTRVIQRVTQGKDGVNITLYSKSDALNKLKDFFKWEAKKEEDTQAANNLIEALNMTAKEDWDDNPDSDLEEMQKG